MKKILLVQNGASDKTAQLNGDLEAEGFHVETMRLNGQDGCHSVKQIEPDVILLEVASEQCKGPYQLCEKLRQDLETETIPVLLLGSSAETTGPGDATYLLEGLHVGANDYIQAPYDLLTLIGKVNSALRLKESWDKAKLLTEQLNEVNDELYQRNIQIEKELYTARQLQQSLLPKPLTLDTDDLAYEPQLTKVHFQNEKLRVSGIYLPCDALGGDLYDIIPFKDEGLGVALTDVSGHGLPAGFITAIVKAFLFRITQEYRSPQDVFFHLNNEMYHIVTSGDYITGIYTHIDLNAMTLKIANGGHPYPFYYTPGKPGILQRFSDNNIPLVWVENTEYPCEEVQLKPGDKFFLFTDGVTELRNLERDMYGEERLENTLLASIEANDLWITDTIIEHLSDFTEGAPLEDDISMVLIEAL